MAYTPTEWECGDVITAEKMNAVERGVADMNAEYIPNEWVCGDTITADKLNHIEQGIANGGGGSSDFSFASVTLQANTNNMRGSLYDVSDARNYVSIEDFIIYAGADPTVFPNVILYEGQGFVWLENDPSQVTLSGDVTYDEDEGRYIVTGDCTITT